MHLQQNSASRNISKLGELYTPLFIPEKTTTPAAMRIKEYIKTSGSLYTSVFT